MDDLISRAKVIETICEEGTRLERNGTVAMAEIKQWCVDILDNIPSAQPFHNITMNDVLKYIDSMPEDVWQEFTACLECRGWELQRRTAKWCGGEFA